MRYLTILVTFLLAFCLIFSWKIPGIDDMVNLKTTYFLVFSGINAVLLIALIWARLSLKAHTVKEIAIGIFIGILSPVLLTLLSYGL